MSSLIRLLPDHIANQIAAGEVIQRPASVVKELMENAIDAGAEKIEVVIKDAGKTLIKVVDNGKGMGPEDAELCFERHATSKVQSAEDLFALTTKGFRGEALASIAAISHVELKTRPETNPTGTLIHIEGSKIKDKEETTSPVGTSFEVKNLFFNVPARRNFLKADSTEFGHITEEFNRIVLAHPEISFTLQHNDKVIHQLAPAVLRKRIVDLVGKSINDKLVPIEESTEIVTIKGFVLKPEASKKRRGEQYFFVNDRFFKSSYFNHAINKAYEGLIASDAFPSYFLYLDVDTSKIDVNVHPTKTEIKFEEERHIYSILFSSVKQALGKYNIAPTLDFEREMSFDIPHSMRKEPTKEPTIQVDPTYNPFNSSKSTTGKGRKDENFTPGIMKQGFGQSAAKSSDWENFYTIEDEQDSNEQELISAEDSTEKPGNFIVKNNLIISPSKSGIMIIHTRRALEQIVYSNLIKSFISNPIDSQQLLFPIEVEISQTDASNWNENKTILKQLGFSGEINKNQLTVNAVPSVLEEEAISNSVSDLLATLDYRDIDKGDIAHSLVHSIAKAASMRKIDLNTSEAVNNLIEQLFQCEEHMFTPGKKKIIETISIEDLNKIMN